MKKPTEGMSIRDALTVAKEVGCAVQDIGTGLVVAHPQLGRNVFVPRSTKRAGHKFVGLLRAALAAGTKPIKETKPKQAPATIEEAREALALKTGEVLAVETFTPDDAERLLQASTGKNFRPLSVEHAARLAEPMEKREWQPLASVIILDENGNIIDGQHRFAGCVLARTPFTTLVIRNAKRSQLEHYVDMLEKPRSVVGLTRNAGFKNAAAAVRAARMICHYQRGGRLRDNFEKWMSPTGVLSYAEAYRPRIDHYVARGGKLRGILPASVVGFVGAVLKECYLGRYDDFLVCLIEKSNLEKGHPALALINVSTGAWANARAGRNIGPAWNWEQTVRFVKAWNAYAQSRKVAALGGGDMSVLPEIVGYDEPEVRV